MLGSKVIQAWLTCGALISIDADKVLLGWGPRTWMVEPDKSPSFYFPDFFLRQPRPWFKHTNTLVVTFQELLEALLKQGNPTPKKYQWQNSSRQLFHEIFDQLQEKFAARELLKAVPFVMETFPETIHPDQLQASLTNVLDYLKKNSAHVYGFWGEEEGMLGASPELLFRLFNGTTLETVACAGTKNIQQVDETFLKDPKELDEHHLVVKGIKESLMPFGQVNIGERRLLKLTRLAHLLTPITVKLESFPSFEDIVLALHPTPALGAFPREAGRRWLGDLQKKFDRKRFGAPVGYKLADENQSACYVAIRNVQWTSQQMLLGAGCGVIAASQFEREWGEIELKLLAIKEMLAL